MAEIDRVNAIIHQQIPMPKPGDNISHYKIVSAIGVGGMGEVFLAEDTKLERRVAIKVLLAEVADDEERVKRFVQEAKAASALNHPNILTVFEVGVFEGSHYIATEYIKGDTLRDRMQSGDLGLNEALGIALQSAAALGAAHDAGIIHRDIKPENIMIRGDGLVKVLDFGLAKLTEKRPETSLSDVATKAHFKTQPGIVVGTVAYMSPEQARGMTLDPRTDIFSLGIVMYELFTGKRPFVGEGQLDLISAILKDEPPAIRQIAPDLPRQLERIVDKSLRKDRELRYQHIKDLQIDLDDLRDELRFEAKQSKTSEAMLNSVIMTKAVEPARSTLTSSIAAERRFTLLHAIIFVAVALVLAGTFWIYGPSFVTPPAEPGSYKTTEIASWTSAPGELFSNATFSPDGKMIAFSSTKSGTKNIWVTQTLSTNAIQVTNDAFSNVNPIWSPKGDEIAFFSDRGNVPGNKTGLTGVWRVPALGGTPKSIGSIADGSGILRRWTASGKVYYELKGDLYSVEVATGVSQRVTILDQGRVTWIDISPDEKTIAFAVQNNNGWSIKTGDPTGAKLAEIASGTGELEGVSWLPEKKRLFYGSQVEGILQIFVTQTGSGKSNRITASETDSSVVDVSPDGRSIIYSSAKEESNLWRVNVADGRESPVIRDLNAKLWPAVSPDNNRVVFQSVKNLSNGNKLFESTIALKNLGAGTENESPAAIAERGYLPSWSPDGSTVAFLKREGDATEIFVANPNGGGERRLTTGGIPSIGYSVSPYNHMQTRTFAWSPDSGQIAYASEKNGASNLWLVRPSDGSELAITDNVEKEVSLNCPIWSSDGKRLAFFIQRSSRGNGSVPNRELRIIDISTKFVKEVFKTDKPIRLIGWTAEESGLIFAESSKEFSGLPPETTLKKIYAAGGDATEIAVLKNVYYYNIFLSDDRKMIAFAGRDGNMDDIWIMPSIGGPPKKLTNNNDSGLYFSRFAWLHDGSAIVFGKQTRFSLLSMITDIN